MDKVNLAQKFSLFSDQYSPKIIGEVNDTYVKLVKFQGDFPLRLKTLKPG